MWIICLKSVDRTALLGLRLKEFTVAGAKKMKPESSLESYLRYGRTLADSGVSGLRAGTNSHLKGQSLSNVLGESARSSLTLAAIGLGAGLLQLYFGNRRTRVPRSVVAGAVGATLAFFAGFTWKNRELAGSMARGALKSMEVTRDEHWLECNPIDYA